MPRELSYAYFEERRRINPDSLDREVIEQAELYGKVAEEAAYAESRRVKAKNDLEVVEANLSRSVASRLTKKGERVTDQAVKDGVKVHPDRQKAFDLFLTALADAGKWEAMKESFQQRNFMVGRLCERANAGFLATTSTKGRAEFSEAAYERQRESRPVDKSWAGEPRNTRVRVK